MKLFKFISGFIQKILKGKNPEEEQAVPEPYVNNVSQSESDATSLSEYCTLTDVPTLINDIDIKKNNIEQPDNAITYSVVDEIQSNEKQTSSCIIEENENKVLDIAATLPPSNEIDVNKELTNPYKITKWYGEGEPVSVQGYEIAGGLIYVGESLLNKSGDYYSNDACQINPSLDIVAAEPWEGEDEMSYWPQYANISTKCRGAYLKWLATGRSEPETYIGYVFLFFYGLERRLLIDGQQDIVTEEERFKIIQEVRRLLQIYGDNKSFYGYANNLLAMEWALYQTQKPVPDYVDFNNRYCSEPFKLVLAKYVSSELPLPAHIALQWVILHPEYFLRTPALRCIKELHVLFALRYYQQFGEGLLVMPNKTPLEFEYQAASPSIPRAKCNTALLPNPFILKAPFNKLKLLVEQCIDELDPYSRYIGRQNNQSTSLSAIALLPYELITQIPQANAIKLYLSEVCVNAFGLITVESLYQFFDEKKPLQIGKKEAENLAVVVECMGFGMVPDIRYHNMKPLLEEKIAIFQNGYGRDFQPSKEYHMVSTILRLGAMVSQTDGEVSSSENAILQSLIEENQELNATEKQSLRAFLYWCIHTPQGISGIKQKLNDMSVIEKTAIAHILISVAYADGKIEPKEIKHLEKLYVALGLNKEDVTSDLHTLVAANEPITVSLRDTETSFSIPQQQDISKQSHGFNLNEELIRLREEETRQVKGVLETIFVDQDQEEEYVNNNVSQNLVTSQNPLSLLDVAHQNLFHRMLEQEIWERHALHDLCKELGLMLDGAMEVLNEWAFDNANAALIEDGDSVFIDVNLGKELINVK